MSKSEGYRIVEANKRELLGKWFVVAKTELGGPWDDIHVGKAIVFGEERSAGRVIMVGRDGDKIIGFASTIERCDTPVTS